jgi:ABC-type multidrug transport system fused ATPase/permease subunit
MYVWEHGYISIDSHTHTLRALIRLSTVRNCDNIAFLAGGQVQESGTHDELMAKEGGLYAKMARDAETGKEE